MTSTTRMGLSGAILVALLATGVVAAEVKSVPEAVVDDLHGRLIESMRRGNEWDYARRFEELRPVVSDAHHFDLISRAVLGGQWANLTEGQRGRFVDALENLAVASFAAEFDSHRGEEFQRVTQQELGRGQVLVRAVLRRPGESDVRFDYVLARAEGKWGIVNIVVDGVSDLSLKRAEYQSILRRWNFDTLLHEIEGQIRDLGGVPDALAKAEIERVPPGK